jgi:protein SCO1/2
MRIWILGLVALLGVSCHRAELPVIPIGGNFVLTDDNGQRFELSSLRGEAVLIFFGYTSCPDACPTTLSKLSSVYKKLGDDAKRVKTLYVSVDPGRDTPAVLKADLGSFHLDALGLTGSKAEIDRVVALYGASYEIIPTPESAMKYSVAHSTTVYALDALGRTRVLFSYDAKVDEIVEGLRNILASGA